MRKKGIIPMVLGLLLIIGALLLTVYNLWSEYNAGVNAEMIVSSLPDAGTEETEEADTDGSMPITDIDGNSYLGKIYIYDLGLELPVRNELTYPALTSSPCRYKGSVYTNDIIIAAHNYKTHFGNINRLTQGSPVSFVDVNGNKFDYTVDAIETIDGRNIEEMESGEWDLSLFTCNYRGNARVTVRCKRTENNQ